MAPEVFGSRHHIRVPWGELTVADVPLGTRIYRVAEEGWLEKWCKRCGEWWPASPTFWSYNRGKVPPIHSWCRACVAEWKAARSGRPESRVKA